MFASRSSPAGMIESKMRSRQMGRRRQKLSWRRDSKREQRMRKRLQEPPMIELSTAKRRMGKKENKGRSGER